MEADYIEHSLKELGYPYIYTMNKTQISDIFESSNRCFLVLWLLNSINQKLANDLPPIENQEIHLKALGEIIYQHGFCQKHQYLEFMKGTMAIDEQLNILYQMFKFAKIMHSTNMEELDDVHSMEVVDTLETQDLNLFPKIGGLERLTKKQRRQKIEQFKKEKEDLQTKIEQMNNNESTTQTQKTQIIAMNEILKSDFDNVIDKIDDNISNFKQHVLEVIKTYQPTANSIVFSEEFNKTIKESAKQIKNASEHIENRSTIVNIHDGKILEPEFEATNHSELFKMCDNLSSQISNIRNL